MDVFVYEVTQAVYGQQVHFLYASRRWSRNANPDVRALNRAAATPAMAGATLPTAACFVAMLSAKLFLSTSIGFMAR